MNNDTTHSYRITRDGDRLEIYYDTQCDDDQGWCYRLRDEGWGDRIDDLDSLHHVLRDYQPDDLDDLPTFGGNEPTDTEQVWSWDETRMLVGTCCGDLEIVSRPEPVTSDDIEALRAEAAESGDHGMVDICDSALAGDAAAWAECVDAIDTARAQIDD